MRLPVRGPFHLEATVRLLQRRPGNRVDAWDGGRYRRALRVGGRLAVCSVANLGSVERPRVEAGVDWVDGVDGVEGVEGVEGGLARILGLKADGGWLPATGLPKLEAVGRALRGARPPRFASLFESFCRVVPYQQVSLESGGAAVARLVERFGRKVGEGDLWEFPEAARLADARAEDFAGLGLSRTKVSTLRNLARLVSRGELREEALERLPSAEAMRLLDELPGIGPWSAALVLLRGLGRLDVFPAGDAGVQRGLRGLVGDGVSLEPLVERMGARRGWLYFCALGAKLLERGLIHPAPRVAESPPCDGPTARPSS